MAVGRRSHRRTKWSLCFACTTESHVLSMGQDVRNNDMMYLLLFLFVRLFRQCGNLFNGCQINYMCDSFAFWLPYLQVCSRKHPYLYVHCTIVRLIVYTVSLGKSEVYSANRLIAKGIIGVLVVDLYLVAKIVVAPCKHFYQRGRATKGWNRPCRRFKQVFRSKIMKIQGFKICLVYSNIPIGWDFTTL